MKRRLIRSALALGAAVFLGLAAGRARAGEPAPFAPLPAGTAPAAGAPGAPKADITTRPTPITPAPAAQVVLPPAAAACAPACEAPCLKKVCVPEQATRTIERRVYGDVCEDFCVPRCGGFGGIGHHKHDDCGACPAGGCANCEKHVRTRKFLVVKVRREEECYTKCNVALEAPCAVGACAAQAGGAGAIVTPPIERMPPAEKVPLPKERK